MATVTNYPIDLPILVIEAQIFVAVNKFQFLPNKLIPNNYKPLSLCCCMLYVGTLAFRSRHFKLCLHCGRNLK